MAATETTFTTAPLVRLSSGRKASVMPQVPKRLTARCRSSAARSLNSSGTATPALLKRMSSDPTFSAAR